MLAGLTIGRVKLLEPHEIRKPARSRGMAQAADAVQGYHDGGFHPTLPYAPLNEGMAAVS